MADSDYCTRDREKLIKELAKLQKNVLYQTQKSRKARKNIRASSLLAAIVENTDDAIIGQDLKGTIKSWNKGAEKIYGYKAAEVIGKPISILVPPDHPDEILKILEVINHGGRMDHYETERIRKDGVRIIVSLTISPIKDNNGKIIGSSAIARDITERVKMREKLKLTQKAIDIFTDSSIWLDKDGRFIYVNEACCNSLGYSKSELLNMYIWQIALDMDKELYKIFWKELKKKGSIKFEANHLRKDGRTFPVEVSANYIITGDKEYLISFGRDISNRKHTEKVLKERADFEYMITSLSTRLINLMPSEADNELKSALKEISEFVKADRSYIFLVKDDGTYIESTNKWCIPEAKHLFNKPKNSSICEDYPYITGRLNSLDPVYFNDIGTMPEEAFRDKNSLMIHKIKSFACVPMVYNKKLKGFVGFDTIRSYKHWTEEEISLLRLAGDFFANSIEHQRTEEALIEEKVRAELYVDLMGHDINNMNQISLGYLELALDSMKNKTADMDDIRNYVMRSIDTIKNSSKLIDNVKKLQNEKLGQYEMKIMNIAGVMSEVRAHHCNSCDRDVRITFMPVEECYVMANVLLKDVFSNLIGNAIKHSTGPLEINIKVESIIQKGKRFYRVIVEDNGPGIPDDLKEKLFERLSLTKTKAAGKGFGLCLIKMIIDDFNGELMVEDRVSGEYRHGCRFIVELPAADLS